MNSIAISDSVVRALGWALVHSLWQGAALALLMLVVLPRLRTARQRYKFAYGTLMAVLLAAAGTFCWMFESTKTTTGQVIANEEPSFGTFLAISTQVQQQNWIESMTDWLDEHHVLIVSVWLLGFVFFMFRLVTGLWQVHKLQTQQIRRVEEQWQAKIDVLSERLGLKKVIHLLESALIRSPMSIGWIKPVILFPVGLINRLSPGEVEAILAHELAHIARRDWIFNLVQAFIEALFYYHPAVWWVSAVIRSERENCCDDAALTATGNPLIFAKALVQVQELATPAPRLALGIGGSSRRRPLLLERVRRILNQPQQKSQVMEKLTATAILLALLMIVGLRANTPNTVAAAFSQITDWPGSLWSADQPDEQITTDSVPKPKNTQKITREDDNGKVEMELNDGKITRLNVDGKEIPADEYQQYSELTTELQRTAMTPPPTPPFPPTPPVAPFPAAPGMTPAPGVPPVPPVPPMPYTYLSGPRISTITDKDGSVIIKLEKDGKPMELKVTDGEVWMDGKKLEKGEYIQIPGMGFNFNMDTDHEFNFQGLNEFEFPNFSYSFSDEERAHWQEEMDKIREHADELREKYRDEYRELQEKHREMSDEDRKELEKEMMEYQKEWQEHQREWQKELEEWQKSRAEWQGEREKARAGRPTWRSQGGDFQSVMKAQLLEDKLIDDPEDYSFRLNAQSLKINGKKQSSEIHRKYLDMYQRYSGSKMGKDDNYTIEVRR